MLRCLWGKNPLSSRAAHPQRQQPPPVQIPRLSPRSRRPLQPHRPPTAAATPARPDPAPPTEISPSRTGTVPMAVPSTPCSPHRPDAVQTPDPSYADAAPSLDFGDPASLAVGALDARLELPSLLVRRADLDRSAPPLLLLAASDAAALRESSTAALADAHSRADAALARAEAALDRSRALDAAWRALAADALAAAAAAVHDFLAIDAQFPTDDDLRRDLLDIKRRLEGLARRSLAAAVDALDHPAVLRLVRLFPLLALADEGLQVYVAYLKKVVALRADAYFAHLKQVVRNCVLADFDHRKEILNFDSATQRAGERPDFVGCLTHLYNDIVLAVDEYDYVLRELGGEDGVASAINELQKEWDSAINELQKEWDSRGTQILCVYSDYQKLACLASDKNSDTKNLLPVVGSMASAAGGNEGPDPREIELYLEEIRSLTKLGEDYTEFMVNKIRGLRDVKPELGSQAMKAFRNWSFNKMEQDLTGFYVIYKEFFMVDEGEKKMIMLKSSDGEEFEVEEAVAMESWIIRHVIEDCADNSILLPNINSKILSKVIEYCNKHVHATAAAAKAGSDEAGSNNSSTSTAAASGDYLKNWDADFVKVDKDTLFDLVLAANYLNIKGLLDLTCHTVADMVKGMTPNEICKIFNIRTEFTLEEEEEIRRDNQWAF